MVTSCIFAMNDTINRISITLGSVYNLCENTDWVLDGFKCQIKIDRNMGTWRFKEHFCHLRQASMADNSTSVLRRSMLQIHLSPSKRNVH